MTRPTHLCDPDRPDGCTVCGDDAYAATVLAIDRADGTAAVDARGRHERVALDLLDGVTVGDTLLVHLGFAIARQEGRP